MSSIQRKVILIIIFTVLFLPFIGVLLFVRSDYSYVLFFLPFVCFGILLISLIIYFIWEDKVKYKLAVLITIPVFLIVFYAGYGEILELASLIDFNVVRKNELKELVLVVKDENFEKMSVSRDKKYIWVDNQLYNNSDSIFSQIKISREQFDRLVIQMSENKIFSILKKDDIIYFTTGGFIDSESGYAYSESNIKPEWGPAGEVYTWQRVNDNWYYWYSD